ncbi:hypothetical protein [Campylobacter taeniopygiae]|uniref:Uncharacterized protein n=1 Tax=Campylobacter taeniopygiae TaxID=2510188 RepID=A0ABY2THV2_9BACT|nr:hypothetical protein [Campylobacter taeniopygiae]TKX33692.1 hypothetical protein CQA75_05980 [Campylobacter taeniopygiae]
MPKLYEAPDRLIINFTLSEDTDTILFKKPWEKFEILGRVVGYFKNHSLAFENFVKYLQKECKKYVKLL